MAKKPPKKKTVSHLAQLTEAQAVRVWVDYHQRRVPQAVLAKRYHLSQAAISQLVNGRTYREATKHLRKAA